MSEGRFYRQLRGAARVALMLVVFVLTVEVCTRIDDKIRFGAPFLEEYSAARLTGRDDDGLPYNIPNSRFEKWHNNSLGFRGKEVSAAKSAGVVRVVCMGSSESYGSYEGVGLEWPTQLQNGLQGEKWEVINASVVGIDISMYKDYLAKYVLPFHPDVILIMANPYRFATVHKRRSVQKRPGMNASTGNAGTGLASYFTFRSLRKLKQSLKAAVGSNFPELLKEYQEWDMGRQVTAAEKSRLGGSPPLNKIEPSCQAAFREELDELVDFIRSKNIQIVLTSYPTLLDRTNEDRYREVFLDNRRFCAEFSFAGMNDVTEKLNVVASEVAQSKKVRFVDLYSMVPKDSRHFGDNVHYTDDGAKVIASTIAEALMQDIP